MVALATIALVLSTLIQIVGGFADAGRLAMEWFRPTPDPTPPIVGKRESGSSVEIARPDLTPADDCYYLLFSPVVIGSERRPLNRIVFDRATKVISSQDSLKGHVFLLKGYQPGKYEFSVHFEKGANLTPFEFASRVNIDQTSSYYLLNSAEGRFLGGEFKPVSGDDAKRFVASHGIDFPSCRGAKAGVSW
jgi:hypothetical protein